MLLAEEFVLLALAPDGTVARGAVMQYAAALGVTGALLTELIDDGHLCLDNGLVHLTGTVPKHPLLAQALDSVRPFDGMKLKSRLSRIKHAGWSEVVESMIHDGVLGREKRPLRLTRHPVLDPHAHGLLLDEVRQAAIGAEPLDHRMATLLALAGPCQMLEVVAPARRDRPAAKRLIKAATEQVPVAQAVEYVVDADSAVFVAH